MSAHTAQQTHPPALPVPMTLSPTRYRIRLHLMTPFSAPHSRHGCWTRGHDFLGSQWTGCCPSCQVPTLVLWLPATNRVELVDVPHGQVWRSILEMEDQDLLLHQHHYDHRHHYARWCCGHQIRQYL